MTQAMTQARDVTGDDVQRAVGFWSSKSPRKVNTGHQRRTSMSCIRIVLTPNPSRCSARVLDHEYSTRKPIGASSLKKTMLERGCKVDMFTLCPGSYTMRFLISREDSHAPHVRVSSTTVRTYQHVHVVDKSSS